MLRSAAGFSILGMIIGRSAGGQPSASIRSMSSWMSWQGEEEHTGGGGHGGGGGGGEKEQVVSAVVMEGARVGDGEGRG